MVVKSLGPGKFYGTSLPRPRIYTDLKFNDHRVDPPVPVTDPFMSWAQEAHWSMGGLSFNRLRLQGKIEGSVDKLRSQRDAYAKAQAQAQAQAQARIPLPGRSDADLPRRSKRSASGSPSPPPAPVAAKRRRLMDLISEEEEEEEEVEARVPSRGVRRRLVKKLGDDFDRVASENEGSDVSEKADLNAGSGGGDASDSAARGMRKSRRLVKFGDAMRKIADDLKKSDPKEKKSVEEEGERRNGAVSAATTRVRTSPRLAKGRSN